MNHRTILLASFFASALALPACGGAVSTPFDSNDAGTRGSDGGATATDADSSGDSGGTIAARAWVNRTAGTSASGQLWTSVTSDAAGAHFAATTTLTIPPIHLEAGFWASTVDEPAWTFSRSGPIGLTTIASSASGDFLVAAEGLTTSGGTVWTSTNAGAAWTVASSPTKNSWGAVATDATGAHLFAVETFGDLWTSSDSGATWIDRTPTGTAHGLYWSSAASDASGAHLVAGVGGGSFSEGTGAAGDLLTSSDFGATWTDRTAGGPAADLHWNSITSDSTGAKIVAVGDRVFTSSDFGVTWIDRTPSGPKAWVSVASDATGAHLIAASGTGFGTDGDLWTSHDAGATWTNETAGKPAMSQAWRAVASDATAAHLVAVAWAGDVWTK